MNIAFQASLELRELYIVAPLSEFPKFIGLLKHIEKIVVMQSNLKSLPEEFSDLRTLKYLLLSGADLEWLPDTFGCLTNLQHLDLRNCKNLRGLPYSFGYLLNLRHLDLRNCGNLPALPDSFACLINLRYFNLQGCKGLQRIPDFFRCLTNLKHLHLLGYFEFLLVEGYFPVTLLFKPNRCDELGTIDPEYYEPADEPCCLKHSYDPDSFDKLNSYDFYFPNGETLLQWNHVMELNRAVFAVEQEPLLS